MEMIVAHPLGQLARRVVRTADELGRTPVLEIGRDVRMTNEFYAQLFAAVVQQTRRDLRVEVMAGGYGFAKELFLRGQMKRLRAVATRMSELRLDEVGGMVEIDRRMVLSRPAGRLRPLVMGLMLVSGPLPSWTEKLRLVLKPVESTDYQIVAA